MKMLWKPVLFACINLLFLGWLIATLSILVRVIHGEDPLALLGILAADIFFLITGIVLMLLARRYIGSALNWALPFIALLGLTAVALWNVSSASLWLGVIINAALIIGCVATTIQTLTKSRRQI
jgi:hypothetical protein